MTIYRFKIYNSIGNIFNIGKMAGSREQVEKFCKKQIQEAKKNSPCHWDYLIELINNSYERARNTILKQE